MSSTLKYPPTLFQSEYILNKKNKLLPKKCPISCNKEQKISLITMNLSNVCSVSKLEPIPQPAPCNKLPCDPCQNNTPFYITNDTPFYISNIIDPIGLLYTDTKCGKINYVNYMSYKPI